MRLFGALCFLLVTVGLGALRLTPLAEAQNWPASGGALDDGGLVTLALVLSGQDPAQLGPSRAALDRWTQEFLATPEGRADPAARAEGLLQFLHKHLKGYSTYQTRVDVLLVNGSFNCVSSAVVYMILGRRAGLDVQAVATSDHAFCLVRLPGRDVDVETTTAYGFDPGTKTGFTDSFGRTGFVYVPPGNYADRRTIGDRQLLGLLVQNRMADWQRAGRPDEAVGPAIDRWIIEGTPEAKTSLIDGFRNYASWLNGRREYTQGLELVDQMAAWTGAVDETRQIAWAFLNNQVNVLLEKQDFAGAQALASAWKNRGWIDQAQLAKTQGVITDQQLAGAAKSLPATEAAAQVEAAFAAGSITATRRQDLLTFAYGQEVQRIAAAQGAQAAWTYLGRLPDEVRAFPSLVKARQVYAYNWSVDVHNRFASLWNAGQHGQARQLVVDALSSLPDSALLQKDRAVAGN